ncbi:alpha/beta fold hydrolase [Aureibaculum luteum]|uniref:alpha/beta fold hydrolase n=1 Tax=Aureibaculum luteum TaxID=1548456 RepID=UPI000E53FFD5|nr:alpha/beta hydrolase [Aureibaculum luteum]
MNEIVKYIYKKQSLILSMLLLIMLSSCFTFKVSDRKIENIFRKENLKARIYYEDYSGKRVRFIASKTIDKSLPTIIFIHGAPGAGKDYFKYVTDIDLNKKANLITVDRLGYGYSDYGKAETSITSQAESIYTIIENEQLDDVILVSWSYGVAIAGKMNYLHPTISNNLMVAGAVSPKDEKFFALGKLAHWKATRWLFSKALRVSDREKWTHVDELTKMSEDWQHIKTPITYYHGKKDKIVPYVNMEFIISKVPNEFLDTVSVKNANHFILFKNYDLIKRKLLKVLDNPITQ